MSATDMTVEQKRQMETEILEAIRILEGMRDAATT